MKILEKSIFTFIIFFSSSISYSQEINLIGCAADSHKSLIYSVYLRNQSIQEKKLNRQQIGAINGLISNIQAHSAYFALQDEVKKADQSKYKLSMDNFDKRINEEAKNKNGGNITTSFVYNYFESRMVLCDKFIKDKKFLEGLTKSMINRDEIYDDLVPLNLR